MELAQKYDNVIILRTFSKLCSLAGCRIGYAVSRQEIIELINKVRPTYCVNWVAIHFAVSLLKSPQIIENLIATEKDGRVYLEQVLKDHQYHYYAEHGNFIFIKCKEDVEKVVNALKQQGILVEKYSHPLLDQYIRISMGARSSMGKFWSAFHDIDKRLASKFIKDTL